jgi:hypothetical protein
MRHFTVFSSSLLLATVLFALPSTSAAVDGVLEINHACATAIGGCFPGDTQGYPVTLAQLGNYRLTSNLIVSSGTTGIRVDSALVSVDLNGFTILGPVSCPAVNACTGSDFGSGIDIINPNAYGVTVINGKIQGFAEYGIRLSAAAHVEGVLVTGIGAPSGGTNGVGIEVSEGSIIKNCDVAVVETVGIWAQGSLVLDSVIRDAGTVAVASQTTGAPAATRGLRIFRVFANFANTVSIGASVCGSGAC